MIVYSCFTNKVEICMDCVNLNDCSVVHLSNASIVTMFSNIMVIFSYLNIYGAPFCFSEFVFVSVHSWAERPEDPWKIEGWEESQDWWA